MQYKEVISGKEARKQNRYEESIFAIEHEPEYYDSGLWLIPNAGYAMWFTDQLAMANYIYDSQL